MLFLEQYIAKLPVRNWIYGTHPPVCLMGDERLREDAVALRSDPCRLSCEPFEWLWPGFAVKV